MLKIPEPLINLFEFIIVVFVAILIQEGVSTLLSNAHMDAIFSDIGGWIAFFFVLLAYFGKIREYVRGNINI